jgi:hypothetical protein
MSEAVVNGPFAVLLRSSGVRLGWERRRPALHLAGIGVLTLVLTSSGAFDSDEMSLERRVLMFGVVSTLLVVQASLLADMTRRIGGSALLRKTVAATLALVAMLFLMTVEIHALKSTPVIPYTPDPLPEFALFLAPFVLPLSGLMLGLKWSDRADARRASTHREAPAAGSARAARPDAGVQLREPVGAPADWTLDSVQRVQALDHYLHVRTDRRTLLVRGRMCDALGHLSDRAGIQPHRSWWVAHSEIDRIEKCGRDHALLLRNGDRVPVARARVAAVKRLLGNGAGQTSQALAARPSGNAFRAGR